MGSASSDVPSEGKKHKYRSWKRGEDPLGYYYTHLKGERPSDLYRRDQTVYNLLRKRGLLHLIPRSRGNYGTDPLQYYLDNYNGLTRGRLWELDGNFAKYLQKRKLLDLIPLDEPYGPDPLVYLHLRHEGRSRYQIFQDDNAFYSYLRKYGLLKEIPVRKPGPKPGKLGKDTPEGQTLLEECLALYPGVTRMRLQIVDPVRYRRLSRAGLTDSLPTIWDGARHRQAGREEDKSDDASKRRDADE